MIYLTDQRRDIPLLRPQVGNCKSFPPPILWQAHMGQIGKWAWRCTTMGPERIFFVWSSVEYSTELRTMKINPGGSEIGTLVQEKAQIGHTGKYPWCCTTKSLANSKKNSNGENPSNGFRDMHHDPWASTYEQLWMTPYGWIKLANGHDVAQLHDVTIPWNFEEKIRPPTLEICVLVHGQAHMG